MNQTMYKIFLFLLFAFSIQAQVIPQAEPIEEALQEEKPVVFETPKPLWKQKLHYGGNLWLGFFGAFYVDASPMAGFEVTEKGTVVGLGLSFIYQGQYKQTGSISAGPRIFIRQPVWKSIFVHGEYELMNSEASNFYNYDETSELGKKKWGGSPLIGAGFYQGRTGQQRGSFVSLMYNLGAPSFGFISPQGLGANNSPILIRIGYFF